MGRYTDQGVEAESAAASPVEQVYGALLDRFRTARHDGDDLLAQRIDVAIRLLEECWPVDTISLARAMDAAIPGGSGALD